MHKNLSDFNNREQTASEFIKNSFNRLFCQRLEKKWKNYQCMLELFIIIFNMAYRLKLILVFFLNFKKVDSITILYIF